MIKSKLEKDIDEFSKTKGLYWLSFVNLKGKYSNEPLTKNLVQELKHIADKSGYIGRDELLFWFKQNRPSIFRYAITEADPNGLMYDLIDLLKNIEV